VNSEKDRSKQTGIDFTSQANDDAALEKEIEEGLARAKTMLQRKRNWKILLGMLALLVLTGLFCGGLWLAYNIWYSSRSTLPDWALTLDPVSSSYHDEKETLEITPTFATKPPGTQEIRSYNVNQIQEIHRFAIDHDIDSMAWSPDGKLLAIQQMKTGINLYSRAGIRQLALTESIFSIHGWYSSNVKFSPDGKFLAHYFSCEGDCQGGLYVYSLAKKEVIYRLPGNIANVSFSGDGDLIAIAFNYPSAGVVILDTETWITRKNLGVEWYSTCLSFLPTGILAYGDTSVLLRDVDDSFSLIKAIDMKGYCRGLGYANGSIYIHHSSSISGYQEFLSLYELGSDSLSEMLFENMPENSSTIVVSPNQEFLSFVDRWNKLAVLWGTEKKEVVYQFSNDLEFLEFSPGTDQIVIIDGKNVIFFGIP
jgi:WD40 repeat protein